MGVRFLDVDETSRAEFVAYAEALGREHDDSYVTRDELARFEPSSEPAVIALAEDEAVIAAASAMLDGYADEGMSRLRVFHASDPALYPELLARLLARTPHQVRSIFAFLPDHHTPAAEALAEAGFAEARRAYILANTDPGHTAEPQPPAGATITEALASSAAEWAHVVNDAFHGCPGRYEMSAERAAELLSRPEVVRGATLLVWKNGAPAGVVLTITEPHGHLSAEIETLAVTPLEQGKGLGRTLLGTALARAARAGHLKVSLSVSATNRRALAMYLDSGFHADDVRICWQLTRET